MGNFYTNVTLRGPSAAAAAGALGRLRRQAIVADAGDGQVVVYDRESDEQDTQILSALADHLSSELTCTALAVLDHDDDILWLQLFDRGELVAEYANRGGPRTDVGALCATLDRPAVRLRVWWILARPYVFQVNRHVALARALSLPPASVGSGYRYVDQGETPSGVDPGALLRVG